MHILSKIAELYETFLIALGKEFTEPVGAPTVTPFRLVDMYTSPTHKTVCTADSQLRVLICTVVFGLGVNSSEVRQVIHWGPPSDIEEYMQQTSTCFTPGEEGSIVTHNESVIPGKQKTKAR